MKGEAPGTPVMTGSVSEEWERRGGGNRITKGMIWVGMGMETVPDSSKFSLVRLIDSVVEADCPGWRGQPPTSLCHTQQLTVYNKSRTGPEWWLQLHVLAIGSVRQSWEVLL